MEGKGMYVREGGSRLPFTVESPMSSGASPGISFPLGTALVVLIILLVTAIFSFVYHWMRLRKRAGGPASIVFDSFNGGAASSSTSQQSGQAAQQAAGNPDQSKMQSLSKMMQPVPCPPVVFMPGDPIPKFIACPCPFLEVIVVEDSKNPSNS